MNGVTSVFFLIHVPHYIAVYSLQNGMAVVHDQNVANATTISQQELLRLPGRYFL